MPTKQSFESLIGEEKAIALGCEAAEAGRPHVGGRLVLVVHGTAELHRRDGDDGEGGREGVRQRQSAGRGHHAEAEGALQLAVQAELQQVGEHQLRGQQGQREIQAGISVAEGMGLWDLVVRIKVNREITYVLYLVVLVLR